jgi:hypothetical protein
MSPELNPAFHFPHRPGINPDPASMIEFVAEFGQPAAKQQAFAAYLQLSVETLQAQVKFVQALQKTAVQGG